MRDDDFDAVRGVMWAIAFGAVFWASIALAVYLRAH